MGGAVRQVRKRPGAEALRLLVFWVRLVPKAVASALTHAAARSDPDSSRLAAPQGLECRLERMELARRAGALDQQRESADAKHFHTPTSELAWGWLPGPPGPISPLATLKYQGDLRSPHPFGGSKARGTKPLVHPPLDTHKKKNNGQSDPHWPELKVAQGCAHLFAPR